MSYIVEQIKKYKIGRILENISLKKYNTYKLDVKAALIVFPRNVEKLKQLIEILKQENSKYIILGNGSNVIFTKKEYDGIIIKLDELNELEINDTLVKVGAGYNLMALALKTAKLGLSGLEFAAGIPGSIGGAIYMNAGAYKSDMGYIVSKITVLTPELEIKVLYNKDLKFHYRTSVLKENPSYICLDATLVLKHGDVKEILSVIEDRKQRRIISQPLDYPSAGSVFRNPPDLFAGKLIEDINLKGYNINGAKVSEKHANFIVNTGNATGQDIVDLINLIKTKVKEAYHIDLTVEQEFID